MTHARARLIQIVCSSITAAILTGDVRAQSVDSAVSHIGVGAGISFYNPSSSDGQSSRGITFAYRWHRFRSGWGPTFGLDWHSTDFTQPLGIVTAPLGSLRMRAFLAGFGHTQRFGKLSASASVLGGYAFNNLSVDGSAGPAFARAGISLLDADVNNSAVVKPVVSAWYDVASHVGVGIGAAYLVARPEETVTTATGSHTRHLRADALELTAGLTFGIWKKR
jgi:hypothetical protein